MAALKLAGATISRSVYRALCADKNDGLVVVLSTVVDPRRYFPQHFIELSNEVCMRCMCSAEPLV
jgi:hypothetical protein